MFGLALSRRPCGLQTSLSRGTSEDKEREKAEAEWAEAEDHREPQAPLQCASRPEEPGVRGGPFAETRWPRGDSAKHTDLCVTDVLVPQDKWFHCTKACYSSWWYLLVSSENHLHLVSMRVLRYEKYFFNIKLKYWK